MLAGPASAATVNYTISGTTLNDGYLFGHPDPVPGPLPFSMSLYFDDNLPPTADGRTWDALPNDPKDSFTIGGQTAFYWGLGGSVQTGIDAVSGLRELTFQGDTIVDFGFAKWRTGYQFVIDSAAFTADYTLPGVYTDANALLNRVPGYNFSITQVFDPTTGYSDARTTYLQIDKLVVMNSDHPPVVPPEVPLPASLPLFGVALAILGFIGFRSAGSLAGRATAARVASPW
jgi:hypothetical protein